MKKLLYLLLILPLLASCSKDDDNEPTQDYTSFTITNSTRVDMTNTVIGYIVDGKYKKLASLGDFNAGTTSSVIRIEDNSINKVFVFTDYNGTRMVNLDFVLTKNKKNIFDITADSNTTPVDKTNPSQYPQQ